MFLACNFIKNEALAQVFSCEFYEIYKNTFFKEHLLSTASNNTKIFFRVVSVLSSLTLQAQRYFRMVYH